MRTRSLAVATVALAWILAGPHGGRAASVIPGGFGVMGDSGSDEYRANDNRGGAYASTTFNWLELLVRFRGLNAGPWGTWGEPRRTGYEYNWARSNARAVDVIQNGQAAGLAQQVADGRVARALLMIGTNDFAIWNNTYREIYDGTLAGAALDAKVNDLLANIELALDTVQAAGAVDLFVGTLEDRGTTPAFLSAFPDPAKRQIVTNVIAGANQRLQAIAIAKAVTIFDTGAMGAALLPLVDSSGNLHVGGELLSFVAPGDEPHHAILGDNEHAGTVAEGLMANYLVADLNTRGLGIATFTDQELLNNAGIFPVPPDTTAPTISIAAPADNATVTGSVTVSANASDNVNVVGVQFKLDGANLGAEDTTAPYSKSWNTSSGAMGLHTVTAVARDAAGNLASAFVTVYVTDTAAPTVTITAPAAGAQVVGALTVKASASDNVGVAGVSFYGSGTALGPEDTQAPYSITVPTTYQQNGSLILTAVARDAAGNTRTSSPVTVTVNNPIPDTTAPSVTVTGPSNGSTVSGSVTLGAAASDNVKVVGVQFKVDGINNGPENTTLPYSASWNTLAIGNGAHTITATARDAAGNVATSSVAVTVFNDVRSPSSYTVQQGTYVSGSVQSLTSDDNNYLVTKSVSVGVTGVSRTDLLFAPIVAPVTKLEFSVTLKSSASSTAMTFYAYNVVTGVWTQLDSVTIGTGEVSRTLSVASSAGSYLDATGTVRLRVQGSRAFSSYSVSMEMARLTVTY